MKANNRDVQRISNLAKGYERNLCGKDFLICYGEEGNTRMLEVTFSKKRFNHLVGIDIGRCHIKPWVLYKKALAGTLTPHDLGSSLSQYFPTKALAARMMNAFASSATHVSKVNPLSTRVNAEIWISGDAAQFAIGCLKVNAEYHSSSCYVPSSLQLLKPEKVDMKSSGERMPIVAMLSKDASASAHRGLACAGSLPVAGEYDWTLRYRGTRRQGIWHARRPRVHAELCRPTGHGAVPIRYRDRWVPDGPG